MSCRSCSSASGDAPSDTAKLPTSNRTGSMRPFDTGVSGGIKVAGLECEAVARGMSWIQSRIATCNSDDVVLTFKFPSLMIKMSTSYLCSLESRKSKRQVRSVVRPSHPETTKADLEEWNSL